MLITIYNYLGIILKGFNSSFYSNWAEFIFEFIPQIIFMTSIFGYTIFMVIFKWCIDWHIVGTNKAPSIIAQLLNVFISFGYVVININ